jgi:quercetin dioxygenase-like cupin family protein
LLKENEMADEIRIGGLLLRFLRTKHDTAGALDMFEMTVQPNARMPVPHSHRDWEETVYGLAGTLTFTIAGDDVEIGPGDTAFIPRGVVHGFDNRSGAPATCLSVLTPGVLGPEYFRELAAAIASGQPDPAIMLGIMARHGLVPATPT